MICPGVNLPPPITSELDGLRAELDAGRADRALELCAEGFGVVRGANVSASLSGW
jgi:hypothetical protein